MIGDDAIFGKQLFLEGSGRRKRQTDAVVTVRPRTVHASPTGLPPIVGPYPLHIVYYFQWKIIPSRCEAN